MVAPALDIAAAVIGIVAFSLEFLKTMREVREKHSSEGNEHIEYNSSSLQDANKELEKALVFAKNSSGALAPDQDLLELAKKCSAASAALNKEVKDLEPKSTRKRDVLWITVKTMWKESDIQKHYHSFKDLQQTLDSVILTRLAYVTRYTETARMRRPELTSIHSVMVRNHSEELTQLSQHVQALVNDLKAGKTTLDSLDQTISLISKDIRELKQMWLKTHDRLDEIQQQLDKKAAQEITEDQRKAFMSTLSYPMIESRLEAIHDPHKDTFMWIFEDGVNDDSETILMSDDETIYGDSLNEKRASITAIPKLDREATCSLQDWLQTSLNIAGHVPDIYWVSGKPGSGKSTLMKFLANDWLNEGKVMELLGQWAEGLEVLTPSFYFWNPGTPEQKSLAGMLRSLIIQLLHLDEKLFNGLIDYLHRMKKLKRIQSKLECHWTVPNLDFALEYLVSASEGHSMICFFIDGLDEFEDPQHSRNELLRRLRKLASRKHVKVCVASRPEQAFEDEYRTQRHLKLEDLTYTSIVKFVGDKLEAHTRWQNLVSIAPKDAKDLLSAIATKAEGVFLWVVLAVHDIGKGLDDRNDLEMIFTRLSRLPSELADLYTRMLSAMSQDYQDDARKIFQWMLDWPKSYMELFDLILLLRPADMQSINAYEVDSVNAMLQLSGPVETMRIMLKTRCVGMLEVKRSRYYDAGPEVVFVHRSAHEFLLVNDTGKAFMNARSLRLQDRYTSYINMILDNPLNELEDRGFALRRLFGHLILIASPREQTCVMTFLSEKLAIEGFTDQSDMLGRLLDKTAKYSRAYHNLLTSSLDFAASFGLVDYVNALLRKETNSVFKADQSTHLLFCVISEIRGRQSDPGHRLQRTASCVTPTHFELIQVLVKGNARINDMLDERTLSPWQLFIDMLATLSQKEDSRRSRSERETLDGLQDYYEFLDDQDCKDLVAASLRAFIDAGADLNGLAQYGYAQSDTLHNHNQGVIIHRGFAYSPLSWLDRKPEPGIWLREAISILRTSGAAEAVQLAYLVCMEVLTLRFDVSPNNDDSKDEVLAELAEVLSNYHLAGRKPLNRQLFARAWATATARVIDKTEDILFCNSDYTTWEERVLQHCEDPASITPETKVSLRKYWPAYLKRKAEELDNFDQHTKDLAWRLRTRQVVSVLRRFLSESIDETASGVSEAFSTTYGGLRLDPPWTGDRYVEKRNPEDGDYIEFIEHDTEDHELSVDEHPVALHADSREMDGAKE